jgi:phosphoribosyl 1,2-cyclic phosphate phosphodiesterase
MHINFLGTGAAGGVPLYGCTCTACTRAHENPAHIRRPCCAEVGHGSTRLLLDAGRMDLHERYPPGQLTALALTHFHPDHVQGLFHWRWGVGPKLRVLTPPDSEGCADLFKHPGLLAFEEAHKFEALEVGSLRLTPLPLIHSKPTFGYAIEAPDGARLAYLTDTVGLPPKTLSFLQQWQAFDLVIDCSYPPRPEPRGHNDWNLALHLAQATGARHTWLNHIGHELQSWLLETRPHFPPGVSVAQDGLQLPIAPPQGPA